MNWEEIKNEELSLMVKNFYIYQEMLISSPLNRETFPLLTKRYTELFDKVHADLVTDGFSIIRKEPLRDRNFAFLEQLSGLKFYLERDDEIFNPPINMDKMIIELISSIPTPWR